MKTLSAIHAPEGLSSEDRPSSKKVGEIVSCVKTEGVKAMFPESIENPKVLTKITRETEVNIAPPLNADGLGDMPEASIYESMYPHHVSTMVEALK